VDVAVKEACVDVIFNASLQRMTQSASAYNDAISTPLPLRMVQLCARTFLATHCVHTPNTRAIVENSTII
jgi:hypothetical protein